MKILIKAFLLFSIFLLCGCVHYTGYDRYGYDDYPDSHMYEESSMLDENYQDESESGHYDNDISQKPSKHEKSQVHMPLKHSIQHSENNKAQKPGKHQKRY